MNANAQAYRQYGHPTNWNRYVHLGLFVFEDCFECDKVWAAVETDPLMVHRAIWYNFMSHVDRDLQVPVKLNEWATNISQPYLAFHDPTTLHATDTIAFSWKEMSFFNKKDEMEIEDPQAWIPVPGRRRSKSPPNQQHTPSNDTNTSNVAGSFAPGFNLPPEELPQNYCPMENKPTDQGGHLPSIHNSNNAIDSKVTSVDQLNKMMQDNKVQDSQKPTLGRHMTGKDVQKETQNSSGNNFHDPNHNNRTTPRSNKNFQKPPHPNIPTNDGTHRITIKWLPPDNLAGYKHDKNKMNEAIYNFVSDILPQQYGVLYRWESDDLMMSNSVQNVTATKLCDYDITPKVAMVSERSQMVFGIRFGFNKNTSMWKNSEMMKEKFKTKQLDITISNSTSSSGKMVTAGYILLKAPNTTHKLWYNKYLRSLLPE